MASRLLLYLVLCIFSIVPFVELANYSQTACEGTQQTASLSCVATKIDVLKATFRGVADNDCKSQKNIIGCSDLDVLQIVKATCQFKPSCSIYPATSVFGSDPCPGKTKYLEATFQCRTGILPQSSPTLSSVTPTSATIEWSPHPQASNLNVDYRVERKAVSAPSGAAPGKLFDGSGYISFVRANVFSGGKTFTISLHFRTVQPEGLIFYAGRISADSDDREEYVALEIRAGALIYSFSNGGGGSKVFSAAFQLNDGHWHEVEVYKDNNFGRLTVDGVSVSKTSSSGSNEVDVDDVYVGGLPNTAYSERKLLSYPNSFSGCLFNVSFENGQPLDWTKNTSYMPQRWAPAGCPLNPQPGISLKGDGYWKPASGLLSTSKSSYINLGMKIRTTWPYGLLLAALSLKQTRFIFLEITKDGLAMRFSNGTGVDVLHAPFKSQGIDLCDGQWHQIDISTNATHLTIVADQMAVAKRHGPLTSTLGLKFTSVSLGNVYLGGMPDSNEMIALRYGVLNTNGFSGCIANVTKGGTAVDLGQFSTSSHFSLAGCPGEDRQVKCTDNLVASTITSTKTTLTKLDSFSEYFVRVIARVVSLGAEAASSWTLIRTGQSAPTGVSSPVVSVNDTQATLTWTTPSFPNGILSYLLSVYVVYPGSADAFNSPYLSVSFPLSDGESYSLDDLSLRTAYSFTLTASTENGSTSATPVVIRTGGPECYRQKDNGVSYRGSVSTSINGSVCLNWATLVVYDQLLARSPESGLGNHSYCRNPIGGNRTMPWCYTNKVRGCLFWEYCEIDVCHDVDCYSEIDAGYGYRGNRNIEANGRLCQTWLSSGSYPIADYVDAGLGSHSNYCRNPSGDDSLGPWCYVGSSRIRKFSCGVSPCEDIPSVPSSCGGTKSGPCVFPFIYKGKRFIECTSYERGWPWCATARSTMDFSMTKWAYCLCPVPTPLPVTSTALPPLKTTTLDGTCSVIPPTVTTTSMTSSLAASTESVTVTTPARPSSSNAPATTKTVTAFSSMAGISTETATTTTSSLVTTTRSSPLPSSGAAQLPSAVPPTGPSTVTSSPTSETTTGESNKSTAVLPLPVWIGIGVGSAVLLILVIVIVVVKQRKRKNAGKKDLDLNEVPVEDGASYSTVRTLSIKARYTKGTSHDGHYDSVSFGVRNAMFEEESARENGTVPAVGLKTEKKMGNGDDDRYWTPAQTEAKLYDQFRSKRFRTLERNTIEIQGNLGSGQFGTVEKAIWTKKPSQKIVVAVKTLKSKSEEDRVKFLQEAAIMGQFKHENVVALHGVVLLGEPLVVLEFMKNGDVKAFLQSLSVEYLQPDVDKDFLRMAREIAFGMNYLFKKAFIHRDLAARNVMLDEKNVCKIGDFGLSRDLADNTYYVTHGGKIPVRWTAPEAVNFRKYSHASDIWSYGIVLYEIWSVGSRPYGKERNRTLMDRLESGYRLPPPSGCSRPIYSLMVDCWHPNHHSRPTFSNIVARLSEHDNVLLENEKDSEPISGCFGDKLQLSATAYKDLQGIYTTYSA